MINVHSANHEVMSVNGDAHHNPASKHAASGMWTSASQRLPTLAIMSVNGDAYYYPVMPECAQRQLDPYRPETGNSVKN